jgi:hypothetical protein
MTRADLTLIAVIAVCALVAWPMAAGASSGASGSVVLVGPEGETTARLDENATLEIAGTAGTVTVVIDSGTVRVTDSTCPDRVCVHTGAISAPGSMIACVPNGVVVRIGGEESDGLDARVR